MYTVKFLFNNKVDPTTDTKTIKQSEFAKMAEKNMIEINSIN